MSPYGPIISFFIPGHWKSWGSGGGGGGERGGGESGTPLITIKNPPIVKTLCKC